MFEVGQKVLCVDIRPMEDDDPRGNANDLTLGSIYTIRNIFGGYFSFTKKTNVRGIPVVHLEEIHRPIDQETGQEWAFDARRFRPLDDKDDAVEQFRQMCRETEKKTILPVSPDRVKVLFKDVEL